MTCDDLSFITTMQKTLKPSKKNASIPRMDEKKLHTQEFQLKGMWRNMRCKLLQKRSTGKTIECSKHLQHITIEKDEKFLTCPPAKTFLKFNFQFKNWKNKCWSYHHFTHLCQKPQSCEVQFMRYRVRQFFCHFGPFFALWPSWQHKESKFWKNEQKALDISSFDTSAP